MPGGSNLTTVIAGLCALLALVATLNGWRLSVLASAAVIILAIVASLLFSLALGGRTEIASQQQKAGE